jgi:phosphopantothenoylcysteine decarboxylase/phosphopantothenate--cysteine ligase
MAPAMNTEMWEKAVVQRNMRQLREDGVEFIDPEHGWLSCRQQGVGRMAAPERIFDAIGAALST